MDYLLLDADVWLNLGSDRKQWSVLGEITRLVDLRVATLVVPHNIRIEVLRNVEKVAQQHGKSYVSHLNSARTLCDLLGPDSASFVGLVDTLCVKIKALEHRIDRHIKIVTGLLDHPSTVTVPTSDEMLVTVGRMALAGARPFRPNKNSAGDAVLLECLREFVRTLDGEHNIHFVTCNYTDFSDEKNHKKPHPECEPYFSDARVRFSINIAEVVEEVSPGEVEEETVRHVNSVVESQNVASIADMRRFFEEEMRPLFEASRHEIEEQLRPVVEAKRVAEEALRPVVDAQRALKAAVEEQLRPVVEAKRAAGEALRPIVDAQRALQAAVEERVRPFVEAQRAVQAVIDDWMRPYGIARGAVKADLQELIKPFVEARRAKDQVLPVAPVAQIPRVAESGAPVLRSDEAESDNPPAPASPPPA